MNVIIAEGTHKIRKALRLLLEESAGVTVVAESAELIELMAHLRKPEKRPDVVLLDWDLIAHSATATIEQIKRKQPEVSLIVLVGHKTEAEQALNAGADSVVRKTESPDKILQALHGLTDSMPFT